MPEQNREHVLFHIFFFIAIYNIAALSDLSHGKGWNVFSSTLNIFMSLTVYHNSLQAALSFLFLFLNSVLLVNYDNIQLSSLHTCNGNTILYVAYTVYTEHEITGEGAFMFERFLLGLITTSFRAVSLWTMWPAKNAVLAPPGFSPGMVILHNFREITKQNHDATRGFLLFCCHMTWGRTSVHQLLFFYLLALHLRSSELTGSAAEKDSDKGDRHRSTRRGDGQKHWEHREAPERAEAVGRMEETAC